MRSGALKIFGKELKLLILDVDGVLLDLMAWFPKNLCDTAEQLGISKEPIITYLQKVKDGENHGYSSFYKWIAELYPHLKDIEIQKFKTTFHKQEKKNPYPAIAGSKSIVCWFSRQIQIALCTTNELPALKHRLEYAKFNMNWFSYISSWETSHPKPDPRALTIVTDSLNIPKENALFVGDWYPDLECAKSAGIEFVAVLSGGIPKHAFLRESIQEDHILNTLFDIIEIIKP